MVIRWFTRPLLVDPDGAGVFDLVPLIIPENGLEAR
jgi:hypothetical protein